MTYLAVSPTLLPTMDPFRKRLGLLLIQHRMQELHWNVSKAAAAGKIQIKTLHAIELGGVYQIDSLERYAEGLGKPLEEWLRELVCR